MLDKDAVKRAILHLSAFGDTDIFPPPFEFNFYEEDLDEIIEEIKSLDTKNYKPKSCVEILTPKGALSFRIAHQLFPIDTLLYTSAILQIASKLEELRGSIDNGPFAYRFINDPEDPKFFSNSSSYHDWLTHQSEMFGHQNPFSNIKYVIETDISDFYARIYFHRIEHVLDDCNAPNSVRKIIEGIIKHSRARQSHGLPVGTSASRMLAEAILTDTDNMISQRSYAYTRYVDDFRIVVEHQHEVHSMLSKLAEHLMLTEGLNLNAGKTKTYNTQKAEEMIDNKLSDIFNDAELVRLNAFIRSIYSDEDVSIEDIDDIDPEELISKLHEIVRRDVVDYTAVKVILKALRAVEYSDPISVFDSCESLLYYLPRDFCMLMGGYAQRNPDMSEALSQKIVNLLTKSPYTEMAISRIWVAHLFIVQALPINESHLEKLDLTHNSLERRQFFILKGILKDRAFFREQKTKFDQTSDWEKPALMYGAGCLSKGEYEVWLNTIKDHVGSPLTNQYRKWLVKNKDNLNQKLMTQLYVEAKIGASNESSDGDI